MNRKVTLPQWHTLGSGPRVALSYRDADRTDRMASVDEARAIRFEYCLPAREIPHRHGQRHTPGDYWSATSGTLIGYESWLESKWMTLLDFDPSIVAFSSQPMTLHGIDANGRWEHTPDLFARRADDSALLLDVKNPDEAAKVDVLRQTARTQWVCDRLGWEYALCTEPDQQLWATVSWLAGFRRVPRAGIEYIPRLLSLTERPVHLVDVCAFFDIPALVRPVLFHLCWRQDIVFDLATPLRDTTILLARNGSPSYRFIPAPPSEGTCK